MKKVILAFALIVAASQFASAQISYGLKAGMNVDLNGEASKYLTLPDGYSIDTKDNSGYHAGAWLRVKIPIVGLYVRPELIYTSLSNEYTFNTPAVGPIPAASTSADFSLNKIDVPVLLGLKFLGVGNIFLGPNVQYVLSSEFNAPDLNYTYDTIDEEISVGLVIGAGLEIWKLGLDARFETGFNVPDDANLANIPADELIETMSTTLINQKPNQLIIGLSYKF